MKQPLKLFHIRQDVTSSESGYPFQDDSRGYVPLSEKRVDHMVGIPEKSCHSLVWFSMSGSFVITKHLNSLSCGEWSGEGPTRREEYPVASFSQAGIGPFFMKISLSQSLPTCECALTDRALAGLPL